MEVTPDYGMHDRDKTIRWLGYATLLGLVAVGAFIRIAGLHHYWFSPDDLLHLEIASGSDLGEVWANSSEQMHPPLVFFLLHFLTKIDLSPEFVRWIPLVPGLGVIVAFYYLGHRSCGAVAAITMAFLGAFGYAGIMLSQIVRPYCLLVVLLSIAMSFFFAHMREPRRRHLVGYSVVMSIAVFLHYSAAIPFAAIGLVWVARILIKKQGWREFRTLVVANLPPAAITGAMFLFHVQKLSGLYAAIQQTYLKPFFADSLGSLASNMRGCVGFLLLDDVTAVALTLAMFGLVALWWKGHREVCAVVLVCFLLTVAINWMQKYPFGGIRHSFYLFPMFALLLGGAVQFAVEWTVSGFESLERHRGKCAAVGLAVVLVSAWPLTTYYARFDYLRRSDNAGNYSVFEFPTTKSAYEKLIAFLDDQVGPNDIIVASRQTSHYLRYATRYDPNALSRPRTNVLKLEFRGKTVFVPKDHLSFGTADQVTAALRDLKGVVDFAGVSHVWLLDMGWGDGIGDVARAENPFSRSGRRRLAGPGIGVPGIGATLAVAGKDIASLLDD